MHTKIFTIETNGDLKSLKWTSKINQKLLINGDLMQDYVSCHTPDQLEKFKNFPSNTLHTIIKNSKSLDCRYS
jgi:hypothetical protein